MEQLATGFLPNKAVEKTDKNQVFMNKRMKAAQVGRPGGDWELVERDIPEPDPGQVRVKVEACGICHSDTLVKEGLWPGLQYPRVPGHEIAGRIDAIGADITQWKEGDRVGVGWHGGHDLVCDRCRRGDFAMCVNRKVTGIDFDGGYAEFLIAPVEALAAIPDDLPAEEAGPFMCAGVTVYNALRNSGARAGEVVAVQASAVSAISVYSTRGKWDFTPSRSVAAKTKKRWPESWERTSTSIPAQSTPWQNCKNSEARA